MKTLFKLFVGLLLISPVILFTNCSSDTEAQQTSFYITDAPIDNAEVSAVFITIADVMLNGQSVASFTGKKTLDIRALQNGQTSLVGSAALDAKAYSNLELILDLQSDATGNAPGCYVEMLGGAKHDLAEGISATTTTISAGAAEVREFAENKFVIDFDLRKAIKASATGASEFAFVSEAELNAAVRTVVQSETGTVEGSMNDVAAAYDEVIVYAYEKGNFDENTETSGQGESNVTFANAVSSTIASNTGDYELHFLEDGDYEIHFAAYDEESDGSLSFSGMLEVNALLGIETNNVSVSAESTTTVNVDVVGFL